MWRFPLSVDAGLAPRLNGAGGVDVVDAVGGLVGSVPTPVMWDSKADPVSGWSVPALVDTGLGCVCCGDDLVERG